MRLQIVGVALAIGLSFSAATQAGGVSGSMLGNTCSGCHGVSGASAAETMPTIGGQSKAYLEATMKQYRDGSRASTIMGRIAKGYNDEQISAMSAFFAKQPWVSAPQPVDAKLAKQGEALYAKKCKMCHAENGSKVADGAPPRLAGQWSAYLRNFLDCVNDAKCANNHPMKEQLFGKTTKAEIDALLQFFASKK